MSVSLLTVTDLFYLDSLPYSVTVTITNQSPIFTDALSGQGQPRSRVNPLLDHFRSPLLVVGLPSTIQAH